MPTLGLAMIVRDEEKDLPICLGSVRGIFDEIVIVDTGSTDRTKAVAKEFGAKIHDFKWIDDFSAARNFAFSKISTEWTCWLDADDILNPEHREKLAALKSRLGSADAYLFPYNYAQDEFGNSTCMLYRHRILRTAFRIQWKHPIHECLDIPFGLRQERTDVVVTHRRTAEGVVKDKGRNLALLEKAVRANPDDQRMRFYYGKELYHEAQPNKTAEQLEIYLSKPEDFHDNKVNAFAMLAASYLALKQEDKAIEASFRGMAYDPRWAEPYLRLGDIRYAQNAWAAAAHWYELAERLPVPDTLNFVERDNYTWIAPDRLCKCYSEMGRLIEALRAGERALKYRPTDARLLGNQTYLRDILYDRLNERPYRLNLGGGQKPVPSYRNCDLYPGGRVEFLINQCELPYPTGTVHAIYSEHALEHAPSHDAARGAILEWARALRHGGRLTLKVPDLEACCRSLVEAEDRSRKDGERFAPREWYRYTIYGIQKTQGEEPDEGQYHRTGFTQPELKRLLESAGFFIEHLGGYDGFGTPSIEVRAIQRAQRPKIRWLVRAVPADEPSTRIRRANISGWLSGKGVDSRPSTLYASGSTDVGALLADLRDADVVVFTQFGSVERETAHRLGRAGVASVFDMNEDLEGLPELEEMLDLSRVNVFCSTALLQKRGTNRFSAMIPDAFELPASPLIHSYSPHGKDGSIRVLWSGMGGNAANAEFLRPICRELGMEFLIMSEWPQADIRWKLETWLQHLNDADIVVSPQRIGVQDAKSNTKATQAMALGIPVVASPLLSYKEAVTHGKNGFLCVTPEEWATALLALRDDQALRERIGKAAQASVLPYSLDMVGMRWFALIESLCHNISNPPKVDIIIPTFNNLKYLKKCVESIRKNTDHPYNLIVVNSGTDETSAWLSEQPDVISVNNKERLHFSAANNAGIAIAKEAYVCLLNDDTLVSEGWLSSLMNEAVKPGIGAVGPFSNCDRGWLHQEKIQAGGVDLIPAMTLEQVESVIPSIWKWRHAKEIHPRAWVAFYCTLIPRAVIDKVGPLDEGFKSGDEDLDYCRRINQAGYSCRQTYDSFVFHFGGRTRKNAETLDPSLHRLEDGSNHEYYKKKWGDFGPLPLQDAKPVAPPPEDRVLALDAGGNGRKLFVIYTGPAWERWSPRSVDEGGIGGSETCAVYVAREFARRGWRSIVFGDCAGLEGDYDGVQYGDHSRFPRFAEENQIDLFVSSRQVGVLRLPIRAVRKAVWVHDIWLDSNPDADLHLDRIDRIFCLSPWHKKFFLGHHKGVPEDKVFVTRNGIDLGRFTEKIKKVSGRMIYSSSPDRGLETLIDLMPAILKEIPEAELHVFYGFENWQKQALSRNDQAQLSLIERLQKRLREPGVVYRSRVGQNTLAREFKKAQLWAFPTWFTETYCITAAEALCSGTPVVTTDVAALQTTVGDAGILVQVSKNAYDIGLTHDPAFRQRFLEECIRMLTDRNRWADYSKRGLEKAKSFSWDGIVEEWLGAVNL